MPPTFALVSPCGYGNLGDAAIQDAMIANIRLRHPNAQIVGITLNPRDTERRHGIASFPLAAGERASYACADAPAAPPGGAGPTAMPGQGPLGAGLACLRRALRQVARSAIPEALRGLWRTIRQEGRHAAAAFRWLGPVDTLIVSGGGQLDDFWGGPWGHPWALFKWALLARLRKARVVFLSVGYGSLGSRRSRLFVRLALSLAAYRSYRDAGSRDLMRRAGFRPVDPVVPDLAYSRPCAVRRGPRAGRIRAVGVSPIAYCHPGVWPRRDGRAYESYLEHLAQIAVWLAQTQHRLVFFASGGPDQGVIEDVIARASPRLAPAERARLCRAPVTTVDGFLEQAAAVDVVVASRLHGLLLAHLVGTPTVAISYERKVDVLVRTVGQEAFALGIDSFCLPAFQRAFGALEEAWEAVVERLRVQRAGDGKLLQRQYNHVLGAVGSRGPQGESGGFLPCRKQTSLLSA